MSKSVDELAEKNFRFLEDWLLKIERVSPLDFEERIWQEISDNVEDQWEKISDTKKAGVFSIYDVLFRMEDLAQDWIDVKAYAKKYVDYYYVRNYNKEEMKLYNFSLKNLLKSPKSLNIGLYSQYITKR